MRYPGFIGPSYQSQSPIVDIERLVNWYVAKQQSQSARSPVAFYPTPGMTAFQNLGVAPIRGLLAQTINAAARAWVVADTTLAEFFAAGAPTVRSAALLRDANPVTMVTNGEGGNQLFVTSGGHKYILDLTSDVVTDKGSGATSGVLMGDMLDGFFIALEGDRYSISGALDGLTWDPTQFLQRLSAPDPWRALKVVKNRIYLLGEYTTDIHYNTGGSPFPFAPIQGAIIREGIAAPFSAAEYKGTLVWLSQNRYGARTVQQASGYSAQKISDGGIDFALSQLATVADAEGFTYQEQGVEFYVLNCPSANRTFVYDADGGWHERGTWNLARADFDVWHPRCHCYAFDQHLYGDRSTDAIFTGSVSLGLDAGGGPLRRMRIAPILSQEHARITVDNVSLLLENGLGLATGQGADPTLMLQKTKTSGRTWGAERWRHAGKGGDFKIRVRWNRLGSGRDLGVRVIATDPIPWRIADAFINENEAAA